MVIEDLLKMRTGKRVRLIVEIPREECVDAVYMGRYGNMLKFASWKEIDEVIRLSGIFVQDIEIKKGIYRDKTGTYFSGYLYRKTNRKDYEWIRRKLQTINT